MSQLKYIRVFAPATVANVGVGFDILGFALEGIGEALSLSKRDDKSGALIKIEAEAENIPKAPEENTAGAALLRLFKEKKIQTPVLVQLEKSIPMGSGLGGSSTSAVAAVYAANKMFQLNLTPEELVDYALTGEAVASGSRHADNVAPCALGGIQLIINHDPVNTVKLKSPKNLFVSLLLPKVQIKTKEARSILAPQVPMKNFIQQTRNLAGTITALLNEDWKLLQTCLNDEVIESQRSVLLPGFYGLKHAALSAGALAFSFSGSGPTVFALSNSKESAERILTSMKKACFLDIAGSWVSSISERGVYTLEERS